MLPLNEFAKVVEHTPLVSIDLIMGDGEGRILLGKRTHSPAKDKWFVPGGRMFKNEKISSAFARLLHDELNSTAETFSFQFRGVYQHFYDDSFFSDRLSTHYVVLAYSLRLTNSGLLALPYKQRSEYRWARQAELLEDADVHPHTKWYFMSRTIADGALIDLSMMAGQK